MLAGSAKRIQQHILSIYLELLEKGQPTNITKLRCPVSTGTARGGLSSTPEYVLKIDDIP